MKSILGRKVGMTQVFTTAGEVIPVTVVEVLPNVVLQVKTKEKDGYEAIKVGYENKRAALVNKPDAGQFLKAQSPTKQFVRELKGDEMMKYEVGSEVKVDLFKAGEVVDVIGKTKGKGFTGVVKAYGFRKGPSAHGSGYHRGVGSLATSGRWNNRIHPGRKMPGHFGFTTKTVQNLVVISVDVENNAMLIKGPIPGANRSLVLIQSAVKAQKKPQPERILVKYEKEPAPVLEEVSPAVEEVNVPEEVVTVEGK
jgi:large subunit ribosomal protein L3